MLAAHVRARTRWQGLPEGGAGASDGPRLASGLGLGLSLSVFALGLCCSSRINLATMSIASKSRNLCDIFTRIVKIGKFIARAANAAGNTGGRRGNRNIYFLGKRWQNALGKFVYSSSDRQAGRQAGSSSLTLHGQLK